MVRRKVGVRKRRTVREGNVLVGSETNAAAGQHPIAIRGGGCCRCLIVAVRGGGRWRRFVIIIRFLFVCVHSTLFFAIAGLAFGVG